MSNEDTYIETIDKLHKTIYNQDQKIADLEAKLAESQNTACKHIAELTKISTEKDKQIIELKQQLAEKDEEIEQWKSMAERSSNLLDRYSRTGEIENQDKISFAVEQLTLFKNTIVNKMNNPYSVNIKHILSDFDNQINVLRNNKDGIH